MSTSIPKKALVALPDFENGRPLETVILPPEKARVSVFDRSFHFGDSLYEVTRSYDGILFCLEEHMRRLRDSCELSLFETMPDMERAETMIRQACREFFKKFGNRDVYVRITVSRGTGDLNIDRTTSSEPYSVVIVKELDPTRADAYETGTHFALVSRRRNLRDALDPAMKSGNYLNNVLALSEARRMGAKDALLLDYRGYVTEGTTNNFYAVVDGEVWTAPLEVGILKGITRHWVLDVCRREGIPVKERLFNAEELSKCEEAFFSSSTKEVMPITTLTGRPVGSGRPGPITRRIHKGLKGVIADFVAKHRSECLYV